MKKSIIFIFIAILFLVTGLSAFFIIKNKIKPSAENPVFNFENISEINEYVEPSPEDALSISKDNQNDNFTWSEIISIIDNDGKRQCIESTIEDKNSNDYANVRIDVDFNKMEATCLVTYFYYVNENPASYEIVYPCNENGLDLTTIEYNDIDKTKVEGYEEIIDDIIYRTFH